MVTIQQVRKLAKDLGVTINYDPKGGMLDAWCSAGMRFRSSGCHTIAHHFEDGPWRSEMLSEMFEDLDFGVEECDDPECDICNNDT